jgi:hypothetical protein
MGSGADALADVAHADGPVSGTEIADWAAQQIDGQKTGGA